MTQENTMPNTYTDTPPPLDDLCNKAAAYLRAGVDKRTAQPYGPEWRNASLLRAEYRAQYMTALQTVLPSVNTNRVPW